MRKFLSSLFFAYLMSYSLSIEGAFQYSCNQVVIVAPVDWYGQPSNAVGSKDLEEISRLHVDKINVFLSGASDDYLEDLAKCLRLVAPSATIVITSKLYIPGPYSQKPYETIYPELLDSANKAINSPLYQFHADKEFTEKVMITAGLDFHCQDTVRELSQMPRLQLVFIRLCTDDMTYINAMEKYVELDLNGKIIILKNVCYDNSGDYFGCNLDYKWAF